MNTPNFITLPSGLRVNTAHILEYKETEPGKTLIYQSVFNHNTLSFMCFIEDMTAAELDALLQPQGTPIVSPIMNLDNLKTGAACQFTYEGQVKHGVIESIGCSSSEAYIEMISDGADFTLWTRPPRVVSP